MPDLKRTERGWGGHFIAADRCLFRRNTLLELGETKIVVSTVGLMFDIHSSERRFETVGADRHFETMAFHAKENDTRWRDADVNRPVYFDSPWSIEEADADDKANDMHERVVEEITEKMRLGLPLGTEDDDA